MKNFKSKPFPFWPYYDDTELHYLQEVLDSNSWWRGNGKKVETFEKAFAKFHNVNYALGVSNGTHALELALKALEIGPGDDVVIPAFTFISTANAVLNCKARPIFCDVDPHTFCIDPKSFSDVITPNTKAVIPVHMAGQCCDMEAIQKIAKNHNIKIVEDAAHAQGGEWNHHKVGYYSDIATFSFQNRKIMTCGEGGAIITNDQFLYNKLYLLHSVGRPPGDQIYQHVILGTNDRMSEFHAAILLGQLSRLKMHNEIREKNSKKLNNYLNDINGIIPQKNSPLCTLNTHYMYMFYYDKSYFGNLSKISFMQKLNNAGIPCHVPYPLVFNTNFFQQDIIKKNPDLYDNLDKSLFPNSLKITENVIWLPHYCLLGDDDDLIEIKDAISSIQERLTIKSQV